MNNSYYDSGRSNILSSDGIAATSHPLATMEAISILKNGGNAIDAAIAASIVLSVVEPNASGIGGDCFAIVAPKGKNPVSYNGSGIAPKYCSFEYFQNNNIKSIDLESPHSVTIPGAIDAWSTIHSNHGKLEFRQLFLKAIEYAYSGFNVTEKVANSWKKEEKKLSRNYNSKKIFLNDGSSYNFTSQYRNELLAKTLEIISNKGPKEFYEGVIAKDIVESLNKLGGLHTVEDFSRQKTIKNKTIYTSYNDVFLHQCPPNGPGITVLLMMKAMEQLIIKNFKPTSFERYHIEAEITKLAYKVREENIADPDFNNIDLKDILSQKTIEKIIKNVFMDKCCNIGKLNIPAHPETTYLTVVDRDLNTISIINSICYAFGSAITTDKTGILLQNRGVNFRLEKNHPNCIDALKRPLHTIIPGMVFNNSEEAILSYGVMGGQFQPVGHTHFLNNVFDYNMTIQNAIDHPRAFHYDNIYQLEYGIDQDVEEQLKSIGHNVQRVKLPHGGGQAIQIDLKKGVLIGGSDFRKDGCALGL